MENGKSRIIVTEIPYQVNKSAMIENIAQLVRDKVIEGITDVRDESNKEGIRVVIEIRKDTIPEVVANNLLKHTQLQTNFGIINLCLEDGAPKTLGIVPLIKDYIEFQISVLTRRTKFLLDEDTRRLHIVDGLILAHDNIDEVIHIIRDSADDAESKSRLNAAFGLTEEQCDAILAMTLRRLQGMEQNKLLAEKAELEANIAEYNRLLSARENIVDLMIKEISEIKEKFGDSRLTEISDEAADIENEDLIPQKNIIIALTRNGYIKRMDDDTFAAQHRGGRGLTGMKMTAGDITRLIKHTKTHTDILFFTTLGRVYRLRGYQIPDSGRIGKGVPAQNFLNLEKEEKVVAIVPCDDYAEDNYLFFTSVHGVVKRTSSRNSPPSTATARSPSVSVRAMTSSTSSAPMGTPTSPSPRATANSAPSRKTKCAPWAAPRLASAAWTSRTVRPSSASPDPSKVTNSSSSRPVASARSPMPPTPISPWKTAPSATMTATASPSAALRASPR